jgi:membrane-bound lytic murein transglycosylase D
MLALNACVSGNPATRVAPTIQPSAAALDVIDYRTSLEEAFALIASRSANPNPPLVDADAALSMTVPDHPSIRGAVAYFSTELHESIQKSLYRSREYKPMIDSILDQERLPRGLAYLPVIESAYIPTLKSRAGAHGIWQFMPETAELYGLRMNWWIDDRAHPEKSTRAAAQYLRALHQEFGDWSLALAAYNCGPGRVRRAMKRLNALTFWELTDAKALPKETRGYVPTFWATLIIVSNPEAYGFRLTDSPPNQIAKIDMEGPVSFQYLASIAAMEEADLRKLNPQLWRGLVPPGRHTLNVIPEAYNTLAGRVASLKLEDPYISVATYTIRNGESINTLAQQLSLESSDLLSMNNLRTTQLRAGSMIFIPMRQAELSARLQAERFHIVKRGDTLYSIAKANGLTVAEIRDLNQLTPKDVIHAGQRLRISARDAILAGN